jgi:hypothetical protein
MSPGNSDVAFLVCITAALFIAWALGRWSI